MTILIADDYETNRKLLSALLGKQGYRVIEARDGTEALAALKAATEPLVGLIDWEMPGIPGIEVCREARNGANSDWLFLVLVTVRDSTSDILAGFDAGVNDFIKKPFENGELIARVRVAVQMLELQQALARRVRELEEAQAQISQLSGLLPICAYCKKIRDDKNYWHQVENYVAEHTGARFSHGFCPDCFDKHIKPDMLRLGVPIPPSFGQKPPSA